MAQRLESLDLRSDSSYPLSLEIPQSVGIASSAPISFDSSIHQRRRRSTRSQNSIIAAILEACRTPTVQHWIMVKARLGYDTFWKHMNNLLSSGMMDIDRDGSRTLYRINEKGLSFLHQLEISKV